jgi:excisionase family DNA binding protein
LEVPVDRRAVSIAQACASVGVSRRTIYNWIAAGKVEYVRTAGGAVRIFEDSLWRSPEPAAADPAAARGEHSRDAA